MMVTKEEERDDETKYKTATSSFQVCVLQLLGASHARTHNNVKTDTVNITT